MDSGDKVLDGAPSGETRSVPPAISEALQRLIGCAEEWAAHTGERELREAVHRDTQTVYSWSALPREEPQPADGWGVTMANRWVTAVLKHWPLHRAFDPTNPEAMIEKLAQVASPEPAPSGQALEALTELRKHFEDRGLCHILEKRGACDCPLCLIDRVRAALSGLPQEPITESGCPTCRDPWPCPLHGGPPEPASQEGPTLEQIVLATLREVQWSGWPPAPGFLDAVYGRVRAQFGSPPSPPRVPPATTNELLTTDELGVGEALEGWVKGLRHFVDTYTAREEYDYNERAILDGLRALSGLPQPTPLRLVNQKGPLDCFTACLASLTGIPHEDFPLPPEVLEREAERIYGNAIRSFLIDRGWMLVTTWKRAPTGYAVAAGPSPRQPDIWHCVVVRNGQQVHDPHPDKTGISEVEEYEVLIPLAQFGSPPSPPTPNNG